MTIKVLITMVLALTLAISFAKGNLVYTFSEPPKTNTLYPEALPCNPSEYGTHCIINPKTLPKRDYKEPTYCGDALVYLSKAQKKVLRAYIRENRNMVLRYKVDGEFIDAPCF